MFPSRYNIHPLFPAKSDTFSLSLNWLPDCCLIMTDCSLYFFLLWPNIPNSSGRRVPTCHWSFFYSLTLIIVPVCLVLPCTSLSFFSILLLCVCESAQLITWSEVMVMVMMINRISLFSSLSLIGADAVRLLCCCAVVLLLWGGGGTGLVRCNHTHWRGEKWSRIDSQCALSLDGGGGEHASYYMIRAASIYHQAVSSARLCCVTSQFADDIFLAISSSLLSRPCISPDFSAKQPVWLGQLFCWWHYFSLLVQ